MAKVTNIMQTEAEKKCADAIEIALKESNCELVPKAKKKNIPICKFIDDEMFSTFLALIDVTYEIEEKK